MFINISTKVGILILPLEMVSKNKFSTPAPTWPWPEVQAATVQSGQSAAQPTAGEPTSVWGRSQKLLQNRCHQIEHFCSLAAVTKPNAVCWRRQLKLLHVIKNSCPPNFGSPLALTCLGIHLLELPYQCRHFLTLHNQYNKLPAGESGLPKRCQCSGDFTDIAPMLQGIL